MDNLKIANWARWQSYRSDRGAPPWIKLHRSLLRNPEWSCLSDAEKGQLVSLWILAADKGGRIPDDPGVLKRVCSLTKNPDLELFILLGFIEKRRQRDAKVTTKGSRFDRTETETDKREKKEGERKTEPPSSPPRGTRALNGFDQFWEAYPKKVGKGAARKTWARILPTPELLQEILNSLGEQKYSDTWVRDAGRYIPHPTTWLNQERWADEITTGPKSMTVEEIEARAARGKPDYDPK